MVINVRRSIFISKLFLVFTAAFLSFYSTAFALQITQVTNDTIGNNSSPLINDNGHIFWGYGDSSFSNIEFREYDGNDISLITHSSMTLDSAQHIVMSENGTICWKSPTESGYQLFCYDGTNVKQVTDRPDAQPNDISPIAINSKGQVAWCEDYKAKFYDGLTIRETNHTGCQSIDLNDSGLVTWSAGNRVYASDELNTTRIVGHGQYPLVNNNDRIIVHEFTRSHLSNKLYYYDDSPKQSYPNTTWQEFPYPVAIESQQINDLNQFTWIEVIPFWSGVKLHFYDGSSHKVLESYGYNGGYYPMLNNKGQLAYIDSNNDIVISDGINKKVISPNTEGCNLGEFNDNGQLTWSCNLTTFPRNRELYYFDGTTIHLLSSNLSGYSSMNSKGDVVWTAGARWTTRQVFTTATYNNPPVIDPIQAQEVNEGQQLEFTVSATDPDGDNLTTYSTGPLPAGATFDSVSGIFNWTPDTTQAGTYSVTFTATDDGNPALSADIQVDITVIDVPTPEESIAKINQDLIDLNLPKQDMNVYMANLKKVEQLIIDGKHNVAINQLKAFIIKVEQDVAHDDAIASDGQYFIDLANSLILLIQSL